MKKRIVPVVLAVLLLISLISLNGFADELSSAYIYGADGQIDLLGYFQMEGITAQLQEEAICFTLTAETASITFARPLTADGFSIRWNGVACKAPDGSLPAPSCADIPVPAFWQ